MLHNLTPASLLDLDFNEDQQAIAEAVGRFCETRCDDHFVKQLGQQFDARFFSNQWKGLAEMGAFTPATPEGEGGALEICAISEALGRFVFPGPVASTFLAAQVLEKFDRTTVTEGRAIVSLGNLSATGTRCLMPFAPHASIYLLTDGNTIYRAEAADNISTIQTLGGEPWGYIDVPAEDIRATKPLANSERGLIINDICVAAYLAAAGKRLVKDAGDYCNVRKQFGKTIGEFQAVAHPLADCQTHLVAGETLARAAANCFDQHDLATAQAYAAAARISVNRAALQTVYTCHQVFAGIGITLEGPAFHISRRIRQLVSQAPGDSAAKEMLLKQIGLGKN